MRTFDDATYERVEGDYLRSCWTMYYVLLKAHTPQGRQTCRNIVFLYWGFQGWRYSQRCHQFRRAKKSDLDTAPPQFVCYADQGI